MSDEIDAEAGTTTGGWRVFSSETLSGIAVAVGVGVIVTGVHVWGDVNNMKDSITQLRDDNRTLMTLLPTAAVLQQQVKDLDQRWQDTKDDVRHLADQVNNQNRVNDRDLQNIRRSIPGGDQHGDLVQPDKTPG